MTVISIVSTLVVKGNAVLVVLRPGQARTTREGFLHLWLGARTTRKIGISTDRREVRRASGEIVVGQGWQGRRAASVVNGRSVSAAKVVMTVAGME